MRIPKRRYAVAVASRQGGPGRQFLEGAAGKFSTTNYHVFRSGVWAGLAGFPAEGIGSRTKWWFWPNAFVRECAGLLQNRIPQEAALLAVLTAVFALLSMMQG